MRLSSFLPLFFLLEEGRFAVCVAVQIYGLVFLILAACSLTTLPAALSAFAVSCCCQCFSNVEATSRLKLGGGEIWVDILTFLTADAIRTLSSRRCPALPTGCAHAGGYSPHDALFPGWLSSLRLSWGRWRRLAWGPTRVGFECLLLSSIKSRFPTHF